MIRFNRQRLAMTAMIATGVIGLAAAGQAAIQTSVRPDECHVAELGGDWVTVRDVEQVRALIQPPPTRAEAERLVVAATIAYRAQHPGTAMAGVPARLTAYRRAMRERMDFGSASVETGPCASGVMDSISSSP